MPKHNESTGFGAGVGAGGWRLFGMLAFIALASTTISLALQAVYGRAPALVIGGQVMAAAGAASYGLLRARTRR